MAMAFMSYKNRIVVFQNNIARVQITDDITPWLDKEDKKTIFVNPDMSKARGFPPELWEVVDGEIVGMTDETQIERRLKILHTDSEISIRPKDEKLIDSLLLADAENRDALSMYKYQNDEAVSRLEDRMMLDIRYLNDKFEAKIQDVVQESDKKLKELNKRWVIITIISCVLYAIKEIYL
jgi:hypothetical protein